jgi:hypothetical protein
MLWPIGQPHGALHCLALRSRQLWLELLDKTGLPYRRDGSLQGGFLPLLDNDTVSIGNSDLVISPPTNVSIGVPAHMILLALASFQRSPWAMGSSGFPTLEELKAEQKPSDKIDWDKFS